MLHHRQQLDVCKTELLDIRYQTIPEFYVAEKSIPILGHSLPGAEMHLIGAHRRVELIAVYDAAPSSPRRSKCSG